jgi:deferrochelatase/peroxidase EfeB/predicted acylesterase/phospholipase RssA
MSAECNEEKKRQVQRLALRGYDFDCSCHLVLEVEDASHARKFLGSVLREQGLVTFGERERDGKVGGEDDREPAVSIGFTYRGLQALGVPDRYLNELRVKAPAFCEGATARAALRLGDAGPSAAERWEPMFAFDRSHVLISIHGPTRGAVDSMRKRLSATAGARPGFQGWENGTLLAEHLTKDRKNRTVHFGFRDNLARPRIVEKEFDPSKLRHRAGELVLGYLNDAKFNHWDDGLGARDVAQFFRNGSFAVLRKIEQNEEAFDNYLNQQASALNQQASALHVTTDYLKAKLCGRWPNGVRVLPPGHDLAPSALKPEDGFDFKDDTQGFGCPFGAHIRRTNPRGDSIAPPRLRPLFRRGMPYGPIYSDGTKHVKRGLIGLFFCASIDDQFETVMSEWVEKKPMGPRHLGNAKDPLVGHHDDETFFHIPLTNSPGIKLTGFEPFVTTRGTLYALFPSLSALHEIARMESAASLGAQPDGAKRRTGVPRSGDGTRPEHGTTEIEEYIAPNDRFCDIVMEGGVTSGIIYASAVAELAKSYRFSSIGGSSIGAFAAALTAAAEYSRRHGSNAGFKLMENLPTELADEDDQNETRLLRMFRPQDGTRRLFKIFLASLDRRSIFSRLVCGLTEAIRQYWRAVLLALVTTAVLVLSGPLVLTLLGWNAPPPYGFDLRVVGLGSWVLALLIAFVFAVALTLFLRIAWDFGRELVPNGFGLCRGWSEEERMDSDLTGFLHESIQLAAGRNPIDDQPLTFADLRDAPGRAINLLGQTSIGDAPPSINLQVYSTNLAHGRPYRFPLDPADDMGRLFFRAEDLKPYFPKLILNHLVGYALPYRPQTFSDPEVSPETAQYLELPTDQLPIVVAARLGMSFPLLISAVPLWAIDYEAPIGRRGFAPCWMSDGGLCSNFPIHLFDSFVPKWPTFGIALQNRGKYRPDKCVWLPEKHYQGQGDTWDRFAESKEPLGRLAGFLVSLWLSAWRWNDSTIMRMPGVRDRVVRIFLEESEGGVNIKMSKQAIDALTLKYGQPAAAAFLKKFADDDSPGWPEHRWVRFNRLLIALRQQIEGFKFAADLDRYAPPLRAQIEESRNAAPLRGASRGCPSPSEKSLSEGQARELKALLTALSELEERSHKAGDCRPYVAVPRPSLRVRHPT